MFDEEDWDDVLLLVSCLNLRGLVWAVGSFFLFVGDFVETMEGEGEEDFKDETCLEGFEVDDEEDDASDEDFLGLKNALIIPMNV